MEIDIKNISKDWQEIYFKNDDILHREYPIILDGDNALILASLSVQTICEPPQIWLKYQNGCEIALYHDYLEDKVFIRMKEKPFEKITKQ